MPVNQNVMPLETGSPKLLHYEDFSMEIDLCIPLITKYKDYLKHPLCDASAVATLVQRGESLKGISQNLGASQYIVKQVLRALDIHPDPRLRPPADPLRDPKIDIETVKDLRKQGKTMAEIRDALHVSKKHLHQVTSALAAHGEEIERLEPRARLNFPARLDYSDHPKANPEIITHLVAAGGTIKEIAERLDLAPMTVRKVIVALQTKDPSSFPSRGRGQTRRTYKFVDYLQHPKCPVRDVQNLRRLGYTKKRIAKELRVSMGTLEQVLRAIKYDGVRSRPSAVA